MAEKIPNRVLLEEIRENRKEIVENRKAISGKVGRGELVGWLGATVTVAGLIVRFGI